MGRIVPIISFFVLILCGNWGTKLFPNSFDFLPEKLLDFSRLDLSYLLIMMILSIGLSLIVFIYLLFSGEWRHKPYLSIPAGILSTTTVVLFYILLRTVIFIFKIDTESINSGFRSIIEAVLIILAISIPLFFTYICKEYLYKICNYHIDLKPQINLRVEQEKKEKKEKEEQLEREREARIKQEKESKLINQINEMRCYELDIISFIHIIDDMTMNNSMRIDNNQFRDQIQQINKICSTLNENAKELKLINRILINSK